MGRVKTRRGRIATPLNRRLACNRREYSESRLRHGAPTRKRPQPPPALYSSPMWTTIGMLSALCLAFIGLLIGPSIGGA